MRSVHWQQTARHERVIVRERIGNEQRVRHLCLDTRRSSYTTHDLFEQAISKMAGAVEQSRAERVSVNLRVGLSRISVTDAATEAVALDLLATTTYAHDDAPEPIAAQYSGVVITTQRGWQSLQRLGLVPVFADELAEERQL